MKRIEDTLKVKAELLAELTDAAALPEAARWNGAGNEFAAKAAGVGVLATQNEDVRNLRELTTYGLKGLCAYMKHANALGKENEDVDVFVQSALAKLLDDNLTGEELTALALETGKFGVDGMALLDAANTGAMAIRRSRRLALACARIRAS